MLFKVKNQRHYFERHNDFWNDPQTIASGHRLKEPFTSSSSATPTEDNNVEADSTTSRTAPLARHVDVRVNNNGEAVFTEEQAFRDYVTNMLEHVVNSMAEFQPTILGGGNDGTHGSNTQSINDGDEQAGQGWLEKFADKMVLHYCLNKLVFALFSGSFSSFLYFYRIYSIFNDKVYSIFILL